MKKAKPQNAPLGVIARETDPIDSRLSELGRTLSSSRRLFSNQASEKYQSWWKVREQIQAVVATRSAPVAGLTRKHEIFRSGLREWLELVVKLVMDEVGRLSKIGLCHPTWLGDADPAQWARLNVQEFLRGVLNQEVSTKALATVFRERTSLVKSKDDPPSNARPSVEMWIRMASEGPKYPAWPSSTKPWRAPVWRANWFSEPWWIKLGRPSHLTVDVTKSVFRSAQHEFAGRLEYVLRDAEDLQRVECASLSPTHGQEARHQITNDETPVPGTTPAEIRGRFRAGLVATLINELNALRPLMLVPDDDFQGLREQNPNYTTFKICSKHPAAEKFVKLVNERRRINSLAYELAAIECSVKRATVETAWKNYGKKYRDKR